MLHVPAWTLCGFDYPEPRDAPICWTHWALDFTFSKRIAQAEMESKRMNTMFGH